MRRARRWLVAAALLVGLPLLLAALALLGLNTDPGRRLAERVAGRVSGGTLTLAGLSGRFPDALRAERLEFSDANGVWLTLHGVELDWSPSLLVRREARIARLAVAQASLARLPESDGASQSAGTLPVRVVVAALSVGRLAVAAPVAGAEAVLAVEGAGTLETLEDGTAELSLRRLDGAGSYRLHAVVTAAALSATLSAEEPAHGLLSALAGLPDVGAVALSASADGPWSGVAGKISLSAGALTLEAQGRVDVPGAALDLDATGRAPAMAPRADVAWRSVQVEAHVHGPWDRPRANGTVAIDGLEAAGASVKNLSATLAGDLGQVSLSATLDGVRLPGSAEHLLAAAPVTLRADARLDEPGRPVSFALAHPLLSATGTARTAGVLGATAHLDLPDLAPLSALGAPSLSGHAALDVTASLPAGVPTFSAEGTLAVTGGSAPWPALLGPDAHVSVAAALHGERADLSRAHLGGRAIVLDAHGEVAGAMDVAWQANLPDFSALAASVRGHAQGEGRVHGRPEKFAVDADLTGEVATANVPTGPLKISVAAQNLPDAPNATIHAEGSFDGAPLSLDAAGEQRADGSLTLHIGRADWKSLHAEGDLKLAPEADLPAGRVSLRMDRLADLSGLVGQPVAGAVTADLAVDGPLARLRATGKGLALADSAVASAALEVRVRDPLAARSIDGSLDLAGLSVAGIGGTARLEAKGPPSALALNLRADLTGIAPDAVHATAAARLDAPGRSAAVAALQADGFGESLRLLAPARVDFAGGIRVDRARFGLRDAVLEVAGRVAPTLDLAATLRSFPAELVRIALPEAHLAGTVQADAKLTGTLGRPAGGLHLSATGLHLRESPGAALPAASLVVDATLAGIGARLTARATAAANAISLAGDAPFDPRGAMDLRASGSLDLAMFDPLLAAEGRRARGKLTLNAAITGTPAEPRADGTLRLAGGDFQDVANGIHLSAIDALVEASGDRLRIAQFAGRSGQGGIAASGTIGLAGAMPVELAITGKQAKPLASDLLSADVDLDLALRGNLLEHLTVGGGMTVNRADIRVPERLPAKVAVLDVRRPGQAPPPAVAGPDIGLDVTLRAPGQIFVRGRGLDAELQGRIAVAGSLAAPLPSGRFTLRQGSFSLAGTTLRFTSGEVGFDGSRALDPTLNLIATSSTASVAATLTVTGYASAPKILLSSTPDLPQDEILAQLLFHQSASGLSPVQLAQAAAALAQIGGVGAGFDPLEAIRQRLGLDRLALGNAPGGAGAAVEAGRYVAPGIFVGAKQGTSGTGTQATVQIDITRGLKLEATAGTAVPQSATGATSTTEPSGSSVGLTYRFEY